MKKTPTTRSRKVQEMASEYRFDYKKAKPNHFAAHMKSEPDVAKVSKSSKQVNKALRALISAMPEKK